jgi:hypothetical protein
MFTSNIQATIFYRHEPEEVRALSEATIPLAEQIRAASTDFERHKMRTILKGDYFREADVQLMRRMLVRAARHARAHLDDYFPMMRESIIASAEHLEEAVEAYWNQFQYLQDEVVPTK